MNTRQEGMWSQRRSLSKRAGVALAVALPLLWGPISVSSPASAEPAGPVLVGRAVLPVQTYAGPPPSGAFVVPGAGTINGITFPLPAQPVEGFSAIIDGRQPGEVLAMPDNGFGGKANSVDFLIRAYYLRPDFKTAEGGSGDIEVGDFISFRDPDHLIGFPIVNEDSSSRLLTGGDIDPESLQRGRNGELWVGDEFGPWILHFDSTGTLLDPPFAIPGGLMSPSNPLLNGAPATHPNSRGLEAMAITPNRSYLYAALEGATLTDADQSRRYVFEFSTIDEAFTGRVLQYRTEAPGYLLADMSALDNHRIVVIERDAGRGLTATFRRVYGVDLRETDPSGFLDKSMLVDLTSIPDPGLVSLPAIHPGDLGLGNPFWVMCESVEAIHLIAGHQIMVGCDNNLPNSGRNPALADDSEFIVINVAGMKAATSDDS
jgi:hypothetical protein